MKYTLTKVFDSNAMPFEVAHALTKMWSDYFLVYAYTPYDEHWLEEEPEIRTPAEVLVLQWLLDNGAEYNEKVIIKLW